MEAFRFEVPHDVNAGVILKLTAPDGIELHVPVPDQAMPEDEIHMQRGEDGIWFIHKILRGLEQPNSGVRPQTKTEEELNVDLGSPNSTLVRFDTSKGPILLTVLPFWSPNGVERFLQLVDDGFFKDIAIYRGVPGCLLQFGIVSDENVASNYEPIEDDPLIGVPFTEGMVSFASAGAGTRKHTLCFFLGSVPSLGSNSTETPIGKIATNSIKTLHKLHCPGDIPQCGGEGPDPSRLASEGNDYIKQDFPECDFIHAASRM